MALEKKIGDLLKVSMLGLSLAAAAAYFGYSLYQASVDSPYTRCMDNYRRIHHSHPELDNFFNRICRDYSK